MILWGKVDKFLHGFFEYVLTASKGWHILANNTCY